MEKEIRRLEKSKYFGYMFYIKYDGSKFESFDENPEKKSVKALFKNLLNDENIFLYKGIQQAGRTDKDVSANQNILYINSLNYDVEKLKKKFLNKKSDIEILDIKKTVPNLVFPEMIERRKYIYKYPKNKIKNSLEKILENIKILENLESYTEFTTEKGKKLKEQNRDIKISYKDDTIYFDGSSFLPQQVRIMSAYILLSSKKPLSGKYLTLDEVVLKPFLSDLIIKENKELKIENVNKVEETKEFKIFYVLKSKKSEFIGKNGKNIKKLKKEYGNIIVKEGK